jgi:hypothetical protein
VPRKTRALFAESGPGGAVTPLGGNVVTIWTCS